MSKCKNCDDYDDIEICPFCEKNASDDEPISAEARNELLQKLEECAELFSDKQDQYDSRDQLYLQLTQMLKLSNIWIIIACFAAGLLMSISLVERFSKGINSIVLLGILILIDVVLPMSIINNRKKEMREYHGFIQNTNNELLSFYDTVNLPIHIAFEYSSPRIIYMIYNIIESERADSVEAAIDRLLEAHRLAKMHRPKKNSKKDPEAKADLVALLSMGMFIDNRER